MAMSTAQRAMKLLLAASALALLSACYASADYGRRPYFHGWGQHQLHDPGPRWRHAPHVHRHHGPHRHFGGHGGRHSRPFHHRGRRH